MEFIYLAAMSKSSLSGEPLLQQITIYNFNFYKIHQRFFRMLLTVLIRSSHVKLFQIGMTRLVKKFLLNE